MSTGLVSGRASANHSQVSSSDFLSTFLSSSPDFYVQNMPILNLRIPMNPYELFLDVGE